MTKWDDFQDTNPALAAGVAVLIGGVTTSLCILMAVAIVTLVDIIGTRSTMCGG